MKTNYFTINVSVANIYDKPDFTSQIVTQGLLGESCKVLEESDNWVKIQQWDNYKGWINKNQGVYSGKKYDCKLTVFEMDGVVIQRNGNNIIRDLTFGNKLNGKAKNGGFDLVLPDGEKGWTDTLLGNMTDKPNRKSILRLARSFLGTPYLWGGKSPNGFDCSGFIQSVFYTFNIALPRDSFQQAEFLEKYKINRDEVQECDLHFFNNNNNNKVSHVALAEESGYYLHSQGWVKQESFNKKSPNFNQDLDTKYTFSVSMNEILD